jgi:hypothetical protein
MLQLANGSVVEEAPSMAAGTLTGGGLIANMDGINNNGATFSFFPDCPAQVQYIYQTVWQGYPVYVCHDKTAKAIQVLKQLEEDRILKVNSVKKFIELVEKIAGIL